MKIALIEKTLIVFLFVVVLVTFSFAQRDSKKIEKLYSIAEQIQKKLAAEVAAKPLN